MFKDIPMHDGSPLAVKATLRHVLPGRFTKISPAAVELHVTMSGMENTPHSIELAPGKEAERHLLPEAKTLSG